MDRALNLLNAHAAATDDPFAPWQTAGADALDRRSLASWIASLDTPLARAGIDSQLTADNGVRTAWQSFLANLAMIKGGGLEKFWTETEVFRCRGGNQQLATALVKGIGQERVRTRAIVSGIDVSRPIGRVTLADGAQLEADHVVLAVPPPVWNRIAFEPMLPVGLAPQMGSNVKFLMVLNGRFWRRAKVGPSVLTDGPVHLTWESTDNQRTGTAAMVAFSGGPAADTCRAWAAAERTERYLQALQPVYRGIRASFVKARFMDWPSDPWVKASYSFPAPGQLTTIGHVMAEPIGGRLHLAGEHTCPAFIGYMEGALQSGVRVAERISRS
jgi:monoamine oxidase